MGKKLILIFSVLFGLEASSQDITNWVRIDCGSPRSYQDNKGLMWQTDEGYIKTGVSANATSNESSMLYEFHDKLQTLRFFPEQNKNCYTVPAPTSGRYTLRAMFYYGNYDNLSAPPAFDLEFNGNKWGNVQTEMDRVVYYELMYTSRGGNASVCLARTENDQTPFISLLETWQLPASSYASMSTSVAWFMRYRYAYGAENPYYIQGYPDDNLNRVWYSYTPDSAQQTNASFASLDSNCANQPPLKAMLQAIEAPSPGYFLDFPLPFEEYTKYYDSVQLYFTEVVQDSGGNREFVGQVNLASLGTISPEYKKCTSVSYGEDGQSVGLWDIEFSSIGSGSRPPIVSAIEVYTAVSVVAAGTAQDDLDGLAVFIGSFEQLRGWSGDPCLPSDTVWQWLGCSGNDPPRVTSIDLSGYNLSGPIPNFSQMKALQRIDMSNNNLDGPVPDFLGNLPDLQNLDLSNNKLSGKVPWSISQNQRLTCRFDGNPDLDQPNGNSDQSRSNKRDHALIIGLAVGLPAALLIVFAAVVLVIFSRRKQAALSQSQTSGGNLQVQTTAGPANGLSQSIELQSQAASGRNGNNSEVNNNAGPTNHGNQHQDVDGEILELLRQRASGRGAIALSYATKLTKSFLNNNCVNNNVLLAEICTDSFYLKHG